MLPLYLSVILSLIKFSTGLRIFKIDNLKDLNAFSKLLKTESKYDTADNFQLIANKESPVSKPNGWKNRNKILIKRKVPHGLDSENYEFDDKFNTFYKPLLRVHKTNNYRDTSNPHKPNAFQEFESKYDLSTDKSDDYNEIDEVWNESAKENKILNTKNYNYIIYVTKLNRQKEDIYYNINKLLAIAYKGTPSSGDRALRVFEKSGEIHDPLAPGVNTQIDISQKKKWLPHYSPWNYWTYKKTLHQDICPGSQVRVANMCMWIPPH